MKATFSTHIGAAEAFFDVRVCVRLSFQYTFNRALELPDLRLTRDTKYNRLPGMVHKRWVKTPSGERN